MANTGYSGTPLIKKLGIAPGIRIRVINRPVAYFKWLGTDISNQFISPGENPGLIHLFAESLADFKKEMTGILKLCKKNTALIVWVSWYKKSAGIKTDLSENLIREYALQNGLVDVKVCAVSEEWSGLKLVVPLAKR